MKRISSAMTYFYKRVFPVLWLGIIALIASVALRVGVGGSNMMFIIQLVFMIAVGAVVYKIFVWDLVDEVYDCGDSLMIRNRGRDHVVPLSEIMNVNSLTFAGPPRITLRLASPGELGADISFVPQNRFSFNPFAKSPLAEDLIERVDRARRERVT